MRHLASSLERDAGYLAELRTVLCRSGVLRCLLPGSRLSLQLQFPMLADHRLAPALVPLATHEPEARILIDTASGGQIGVGPQHDLFVSGRPREADAFPGKARSQ